MSNFFVSLIRTVIPVVVGSVIAWLAAKGIDVDPEQVTGWLVPLCISVYYALVRWIEIKVPQVGWLLGMPKAPGYSTNEPPAPSPGRNPDL